MCDRHPIHCIIPPYMMDRLAESSNADVRRRARANLRAAATFRTQRVAAAAHPTMMVTASATAGKERLVFTSHGTDALPGTLVRSEGDPASGDAAVDEAYDGAGRTYDFYKAVLGRDSLDDAGMVLRSSVHVAEDGEAMNNAFWNGEQMAYGDGDGIVFGRFTTSLDVIGHELTHGVESFTSDLEYRGQPGALNEHFADVFGVLVRQWKQKAKSPKTASWLVGAEILVPASTRRALRDMAKPGTAFQNDPDLGDDPQPGHMDGLYTGPSDRGGVHINSGIPNRAFVLFARALKGPAYGTPAKVWFATMARLDRLATFAECAALSIEESEKVGKATATAARKAWKAVGL